MSNLEGVKVGDVLRVTWKSANIAFFRPVTHITKLYVVTQTLAGIKEYWRKSDGLIRGWRQYTKEEGRPYAERGQDQ